MKRILTALALLSALTGCQSQSLLPVAAPMALRSQNEVQASMPLTSKLAENEAQRLAKQWSPQADLTHVLGRSIVSTGQPHASTGSWVFSFIDGQNPAKALQIVFTLKNKPQLRELTTQQLPQREPLELRAWGLDSDRAVLKVREFYGPKVSLRQMELTQVDNGRLVWSFDGKPLLDAMHGKPYTQIKR